MVLAKVVTENPIIIHISQPKAVLATVAHFLFRRRHGPNAILNVVAPATGDQVGRRDQH